ncbi:MAG: DUF4974 domain-containing protein [Ferruginibacter sp.]
MEITNRIAALMARVTFGEATPEEAAELEVFISSNPEYRAWQDTMPKLLNKSLHEAELSKARSIAKKEKLKQLQQRAKKATNDIPAVNSTVDDVVRHVETGDRKNFIRRNMYSFLKYAAVLLVIVSVTVILLQERNNLAGRDKKNIAAGNEFVITAQKGSRTSAMLPDGSKIWLNAGSTLSYSDNYNNNTREVILHGEAYFDVIKNPARPFVVHAGDIDVKVLGTAFNVRSYDGDAVMETTLLRGAVEVTTKFDKENKVLLKPNQKLIIPVHGLVNSEQGEPAANKIVVSQETKNMRLVEVEPKKDAQEIEETAWMYNRLVFRNDDFSAIAEKMERWYNVKLVFDDERVKQLLFTGTFEDETVEEALTALQKVSRFTYKRSAGEIHIAAE